MHDGDFLRLLSEDAEMSSTIPGLASPVSVSTTLAGKREMKSTHAARVQAAKPFVLDGSASGNLISVTVIAAQHLPQLASGPCSVFACIEYGGTRETTAQISDASPVWEESFRFGYVPMGSLTVRLLHKLPADAEVELGFATLRHDTIYNDCADFGTWFPLVRQAPLDGSLMLSQKCPSVKLQVKSYIQSRQSPLIRNPMFDHAIRGVSSNSKSTVLAPSVPLSQNRATHGLVEPALMADAITTSGTHTRGEGTALTAAGPNLAARVDGNLFKTNTQLHIGVGKGKVVVGSNEKGNEGVSHIEQVGLPPDESPLLVQGSKILHAEEAAAGSSDVADAESSDVVPDLPEAVRGRQRSGEPAKCSHCSLPTPITFLKCGLCREKIYCTEECQSASWQQGHHRRCEPSKRMNATHSPPVAPISLTLLPAESRTSKEMDSARRIDSAVVAGAHPRQTRASRPLAPISPDMTSKETAQAVESLASIHSADGAAKVKVCNGRVPPATLVDCQPLRDAERARRRSESPVQSSNIESQGGRTSSLVLPTNTSPKTAFPRVLPVRVSPLAGPRNPGGSKVSPIRQPEAYCEEFVPAMAEGVTVSATAASSRGPVLATCSETMEVSAAAQREQAVTATTRQDSPPSTPATLPRRPVKADSHIQVDAKNHDRDPGESEVQVIRHEPAVSNPGSWNSPEIVEAGLGELGSRRDLVARLQALLMRAKALSHEGNQQAAERLLAKVAKYQLLLAESDPSAPLPASLPTRPSHSYGAEVFM